MGRRRAEGQYQNVVLSKLHLLNHRLRLGVLYHKKGHQMEIILYYAPVTCSMVPFINLTEADVNFEVRRINLAKGQQLSPEYMKINPKHKVPLLVIDGRPLSENVAIHAWIVRHFPQSRLQPEDSWEQCQALSMMSWYASGIHPLLTRINNPSKVCSAEGSADSVKTVARELLLENFTIANQMLHGRNYLFGDYTGPDAHLFWCMRRAGQLGVDLSSLPNLISHFERMMQRKSVKKLLAFEEETLKAFSNSLPREDR